MLRKNQITAAFALWLAIAASLSGCGGNAYREGSVDGADDSVVTPPVIIGDDDEDVSEDDDAPSVPVIHKSFAITGSGSKTWTGINTDNKLRVRVTAGLAGTQTGAYGCVTYTVTALSKSVQTQVLNASGSQYNAMCPNAPQSQIIDFSDRLGPNHSAVSVKVSAISTDYMCQLYWSCQWNPYSNPGCGSMLAQSSGAYCPVRALYQNHTATGSVDIEISGSSL